MGYYRVDPVLWDDPEFCRLPDDARVVWLLLLTGPQRTSLPGLQTTGPATMAEVLRRSLEDTNKCLKKLISVKLIQFDPNRRVVRLPKAPKYNPAESPNAIRAWWNRWREIPDCRLKFDHIASLREYANLERDGHLSVWRQTFEPGANTPLEGVRHASRVASSTLSKQEDVPAPDPADDPEHVQPTIVGLSDLNPDPESVDAVVRYWQGMKFHGTTKPYATARRRAAVEARLREFSVSQLKLALRGASFDDWFMGRKEGAPGFKGLEYLLKDTERVEHFIDQAQQRGWTQASIAAEVKAPGWPADASLPPTTTPTSTSIPIGPPTGSQVPAIATHVATETQPTSPSAVDAEPPPVEPSEAEWEAELANLRAIAARIGAERNNLPRDGKPS